jgi:hypothetical protein
MTAQPDRTPIQHEPFFFVPCVLVSRDYGQFPCPTLEAYTAHVVRCPHPQVIQGLCQRCGTEAVWERPNPYWVQTKKDWLDPPRT